MLTIGLSGLDFIYWTTGVALGVGGAVAMLVFVTLRRLAPRFRRLSRSSTEDDLPWEDLLELLRARENEVAESGDSSDKDLPPDQLLALLLSRLPANHERRTQVVPPEEAEYFKNGQAEKRTGRRRWGNPVDVRLASPSLQQPLHGIVLNRSTGGLGIFVDRAMELGTVFEVRAAEAPSYVPSAEVVVRFCRKVRRQYFLGCQFQSEVPWNIRVWFG